MSRIREVVAELEAKNAAAESMASAAANGNAVVGADWVAGVVDDVWKKTAAAEHLAMTAARDGRSAEDLLKEEKQSALFSSLGIGADELRREIARCRRILELRQEAGSPSDRLAARQRLAAAEEKARTEGSRLREETRRIAAELGEQIDAIDSEENAARSEVALAIERLPNCVHTFHRT